MNDTGMYTRFEKELKLKGFAKRSIQSYLRAVRQLQNFCCKALEDITEEDVRSYWLYCKEDLRWGSATLRISYSGIQHFFNYVIKHDWPVFKGIRFEREVSLPVVLSIEDVRKILNALPEGQNRAFYQAVYSLGLRLGEARSLQVGDIDSKRMLVHVKSGKGNKDRLIPMPETTLLSLRTYYKTHRNPLWIFPGLGRDGKRGAEATVHVSETTVQGALRRTMRKLNIHKHVHAHTFRHSYATHLIEAGVPVRHVQDFLGHETMASTMIYLHLTTAGQEQSRSRINQLMRGVMS